MSYGAPPPPSPYGGSPYGGGGFGGGSIDHPKGTTILILGILGLVCCSICAPIAWVMGNGALREIDAAPGQYRNRGQVRAGQICGMVGTILAVLGILFYVVLFVAIGVGSNS